MNLEITTEKAKEVTIGDTVLTPENAERFASGLKALDEGRLDVEGLRSGVSELAQRRQRLEKVGEIAMAQGRELTAQEKENNQKAIDNLQQEYVFTRELVKEADRRRGN